MKKTSGPDKDYYYNISTIYEVYDASVDKRDRSPSSLNHHQLLIKSRTYNMDENGVFEEYQNIRNNDSMMNKSMEYDGLSHRHSMRGKHLDRHSFSAKQKSFLVKNTEDFDPEYL